MPDEPADAEDPFLTSLIEQISELEEGAEPALPQRSLPDPKPLLDALSAGLPESPREAASPGEAPSLEETFALEDPDAFTGPGDEPTPRAEEPALDLDEPLDLGEPLPPEVQDLGEPEAVPPPPAPPVPPPEMPAPPAETPTPTAGDVTLEALDETIAEEIDDLMGDYDAAKGLDRSAAPAKTAPRTEPAPPLEPIEELIETAPPPAPQPDPATVRVRRALSTALAPALQHVVGALHTLGAPVRSLPPSARLIVDFLALSLLLWVPLVWLIALFVVGK
jgi:hypothetical protein